ncbi:LysR family transcriptional regulator [Edwardsiella piscicida]|uniref:LysR family transcriptional regulator n=1 Tax=Edwardsiella piscicida TaxID=1263550 RepID=UPI0005A2D996
MSNPLQRIDVKTIALFCLIAENHSMSKTAELMHMTPSAVSKRIHELESLTQLTLFQRLPGKMALTREGETLLREAGYLVGSLDRLWGSVQRLRQRRQCQIRLLANTSSIIQFLSRDISAFLRRYPDIGIMLTETDSDDVRRALAENRADIGIYFAAAAAAGLEGGAYNADRLVLLVAETHPLASQQRVWFASTLDYSFVTFNLNSAIYKCIAAQAALAGRELNVTMRSNDFSAICQMVRSGIGVGILPAQTLDRVGVRQQGIRAIALRDGWAERVLYISISQEAQALPAARRLYSYLLK